MKKSMNLTTYVIVPTEQKKTIKRNSKIGTKTPNILLSETVSISVDDDESRFHKWNSSRSWKEFHEYLIKYGSLLDKAERELLYSRVMRSLQALLPSKGDILPFTIFNDRPPVLDEQVKTENTKEEKKLDDVGTSSVEIGMKQRTTRRSGGVASPPPNQITQYFISKTNTSDSRAPSVDSLNR